MKSSAMPLTINIQTRVKDQRLLIMVSNSGSWVSADDPARSPSSGTGTGLNNVKQRLENRFPDNYSLKTEERDGQVVVTMEIVRTLGETHE